ncbi:hypothetical protein [Natrinema thermotolerans]
MVSGGSKWVTPGHVADPSGRSPSRASPIGADRSPITTVMATG